MEKERIRGLWIGDAVTPTGFARVNHSIIGNLPKDKYEIDILGINYYGDPHPYKDLNIYPASSKGHIYGFNRIKEFGDKPKYDFIFMLNDAWILAEYIKALKENFKDKLPPIITYMPVDSKSFDPLWFKEFDAVKKLGVYTQYGYDVVKEAAPDLNPIIVPHGTATETFYKIDKPVSDLKDAVFPHTDEFRESFIFLNANRNQPRKRIDMSFEGFAIFAKDKPKNVKYYHHAGIEDVGWDIIRLARLFNKKYGYSVEERLIVTNMSRGVQQVSDGKLNEIYNACEVGVNTGYGEGWGLTNVEHAVTHAAQIVPDHSACRELFSDCGLLIPTTHEVCFERTCTYGVTTSPELVAQTMETIYSNTELRKELAQKAYDKFRGPEYEWKNIAMIWDGIIEEVL
jgi:glycosyltransferase involved in cell wall biosynthesis